MQILYDMFIYVECVDTAQHTQLTDGAASMHAACMSQLIRAQLLDSTYDTIYIFSTLIAWN